VYASPSQLPESARKQIVDTLYGRLLDGLDLHSQIKVAHWNLRGPQFSSLHPLFETFAVSLANYNDEVAERAVTLGGRVDATARAVAAGSTVPEYPAGTVRDLDHVRLLAERIELWLGHARAARGTAGQLSDDDTVDLFTRMIAEFEKHAWFLRASLG
jgi:starvation-inducible DNA-binding protein